MNVEARLARLEERSENIQRGIADLKVDFRDVRKDLSALGNTVASSEGKIIKWMVGTLFAATGAAFTFAKYVS